jgi:hypothetical protein
MEDKIMKTILKSLLLLLSVIFFLYSCKQENGEGEGNMNEPKVFNTPEEAAAKAKSDLIEVLETNKDLDLGIDIEKLRSSQPAKMIKYADVDFQKLLTTQNVQSLSDISDSPKSMLTPFVTMNQVIGIVEVGPEKSGWKVVGLGDKPVKEDLNTTGIDLSGNEDVTVYEVPNLKLYIYGVRKNGSETYHLNFGQYTLRDSTSIQDFYPELHESSIKFQREYGGILKKERLVE